MTMVPARMPMIPAISDSRALRLGMVFLLYVAQGVPLGLFYIAIPAWLAASGVSAAGVGTVLGATSLPWTLKFVNGFIMERYPYLPMGRRRAWLIGSQGLIIVGLLAMAAADPAPTDILLLSAFAFVINCATTFQDVAIDGLAVDLVPDEERAQANGLMFGGQAIGMAGAGATVGVGIVLFGFPAVLAAAAGFVLLLVVAICLCRERPGERLLPWTGGTESAVCREAHLGAWLPVLRTTWAAMLDRRSLLALPILLMSGLHSGLYSGGLPLVAADAAGWPQERIASFSSTGALMAGLLAATLYGVLIAALGVRRSLALGCALILATALLMLALAPAWPAGWPIAAMFLASDPLNYLLAVAQGVVAMRLCRPEVAATQFTLYMASSNLGRTIGSALLGPLDQLGGGTAMIGAIALSGLLGLLVLRGVER